MATYLGANKSSRSQAHGLLVCLTMLVLCALPLSSSAVFLPQINYQGKLTNSSGVTVADGSYNITFRLYTVASGGSDIWEEERTGANRVTVTNGLFSVMLGEVTPLTGVDWNQTLYLGVEVGGAGAVASWDGEMSPRKIIGAVAAAFEAGQLDGLDSTQFVRSDSTSTIATSSTSAVLTINQTGSGTLLDLKKTGTSYFQVTNAGVASTSALTVDIDATIKGNLTVLGGITLGGEFRTTWPSGGSSSFWATTTNSLVGYPSLTGDYAIVIGASATSAPNVKFQVTGNTYLLGNATTTGNLDVGTSLTLSNLGQGWLHTAGGANTVTASTSPTLAYLTATSTTKASTFPYASTTALTVSGTGGLTLGSLTGPLQAVAGVVSATGTLSTAYGGTNATSFTANTILAFNGTSFISTTSPTATYFYATSTTATSTFAGAVIVGPIDDGITLSSGDIWASMLRFSATSSIYSSDNDLIFQDDNAGVKTLSELVAGSCSQANAVISGGLVTYSGSGFTYDVPATTYCINGLQYSITAAQTTLADADATADRIDIIAVNSSSAIEVITGATSTNPIAPSVNPDTQLELTFVYVKAGATQPGSDGTGPAREYIYRENIEWVGAQSFPGGGVVDFNSIVDPQAGSKNIEVTTPLATGGYFQFSTSTATWNPTGYQNLSFYIKNKTAWSNAGDRIRLTFRDNSGAQVGNIVVLLHNTFGFDRSNTTAYQKITIPLATFGSIGTAIKTLRFAPLPVSSGTLNFRIDGIIAEGSSDGGAAPTTGLSGTGLEGQLSFWTGTSTLAGSNALFWDITNGRLGIGTTSPYAALSVVGEAVASYFTATSTRTASTFPYASSTALTISGTGGLYVGTLTGPLQAINGAVSASSTLSLAYGGTGASSFDQGWLHSSGGTAALTSSTSPTVRYITATSTSATSTFAGGLAIETSGLVYDFSSNNVGIGKANPQALLDVAGTASSTGLVVNGNFTLTTEQPNNIINNTNTNFGSENSLHFQLAGAAHSGLTAGESSSGSEPRGGAGLNSGANYLEFFSDNFVWNNTARDTRYMTLTSSGFLGIGTTTPTSKLVIYDEDKITDAIGNMNIYTSDAMASGKGGSIGFGGSNGQAVSPYIFGKIEGVSENNGYAGALVFATARASGGTVLERMRIDSNGNVGVGTTSPYAALSVVGEVVATNFTATSTRVASTFPYASTTALTVSGTDGLYVGTLTGPLQAISGSISATSTLSVAYGGTGLTTLTSGTIYKGNGTAALATSQITDNGTTVKVGTTVTPLVAEGFEVYGTNRTLAAGRTIMQILSTDTATADFGGSLGLGGRGGGNAYPFAFLAGRADNPLNGYAGYFQISTSASGGIITEVMRVTSGLNVGIGTTSPSRKLSVLGTGYLDFNSNTDGLRLVGATEGTQLADVFVGSTGQLILDTTAGGSTAGYIEVRPEDNEFGFRVAESDGTGSGTYGNFYAVDATDDYLTLNVSSATAPSTGLNITASGKVGVGTSTPYGHFSNHFDYNASAISGTIGVPGIYTDTKITGDGGGNSFYGLYSRIGSDQQSGSSHYAVRGEAYDSGGANTDHLYGLYGQATNGDNGYALYVSATGNINNYAGYFADGNIYANSLLQVCNGACGSASLATAVGEIYAEGDIEADGNLTVAGTLGVGTTTPGGTFSFAANGSALINGKVTAQGETKSGVTWPTEMAFVTDKWSLVDGGSFLGVVPTSDNSASWLYMIPRGTGDPNLGGLNSKLDMFWTDYLDDPDNYGVFTIYGNKTVQTPHTYAYLPGVWFDSKGVGTEDPLGMFFNFNTDNASAPGAGNVLALELWPTGQAKFNYNVGVGATSTALFTVAGEAKVAYLTATSTTATSTLEGGLAIETSGFVYDRSTNNVGIGTAAPANKLSVTGASNGNGIGYFTNTQTSGVNGSFALIGQYTGSGTGAGNNVGGWYGGFYGTGVASVNQVGGYFESIPTNNVGITAGLTVVSGSATAGVGGDARTGIGVLAYDNTSNRAVIGIDITLNSHATSTNDFGMSINAPSDAGYGSAIKVVDGGIWVTSNDLTDDICAGGTITSPDWCLLRDTFSDVRLKNSIEPLGSVLEEVLALNPVAYKWNESFWPDNDIVQMGFLAQEVQPIFPGFVRGNGEDGYLSLDSRQFNAILVKAIQEQQSQIEELRNSLATSTDAMSDDDGGMLNELITKFSLLFERVEGALVYLKDIAVASLIVGSPDRPTGITLYDEETGEPYCLKVVGGETHTVAGVCTKATISTPTPPPAPSPDGGGDEGGEEVETPTPTSEATPENTPAPTPTVEPTPTPEPAPEPSPSQEPEAPPIEESQDLGITTEEPSTPEEQSESESQETAIPDQQDH